MPVHRKKKDTTTKPPSSTQEQTVPPLPDQQTFQQYLRELASSAIRVGLEEVMRQELDALIGVGWGRMQPQAQRVSQRLLHPRDVQRDDRKEAKREKGRLTETDRGSLPS